MDFRLTLNSKPYHLAGARFSEGFRNRSFYPGEDEAARGGGSTVWDLRFCGSARNIGT